MVIKVNRSIKHNKFCYSTNDLISWRGEANFTFGLKLREISVVNDDQSDLAYSFRQTNLLLNLIDSIPLINIFTHSYYEYFECNVACGKTKRYSSKSAYYFNISNDVYEINTHSNSFISIMKNNEQVMLIKKPNSTYMEKNEYTIEYSDEMKDSIHLVVLFCILIDVTFYPMRLRFNLVKYEKEHVFNDKFKERVLWKP